MEVKMDSVETLLGSQMRKTAPLNSSTERALEDAVLSPRFYTCLLYTSPSPRDRTRSRMPSSA